jgi:tetratricopeptide (TPR) repeat protein
MSARVTVSCALASFLLGATSAPAQFWDKFTNPKVNVTIRHPPGLGLQVNKVAFGAATGEASQQFIDQLTEHFVRANIEVVERQQLEAMLAEHNFSLSGYVDAGSAAEMGKILGPSVLLFVNIPRHRAEQKKLYDKYKDGKGYPHVRYISRTHASARGSIRAVDLATGRVFAAQTLESTIDRENSTLDDCCAEFPDQSEVLDAVMNDLVAKAHRLFLPWSEPAELYFFDDKDCGLNVAQQHMKSGNLEGALQVSLANVESCKTNPKAKEKQRWHASYNAGMAYFALGDFTRALEHLNAAQQIKAADITTEAIGTCMRAQSLARDMQRVEERMALDATLGNRKAEATPAPSAPDTAAGAGRGNRVVRVSAKGSSSAPAPASPGATPAGQAAAAPRADSSIEDRLLKLDGLLKKGLITKPEYDKKKADLLKEL